jgi:hypothetical protein
VVTVCLHFETHFISLARSISLAYPNPINRTDAAPRHAEPYTPRVKRASRRNRPVVPETGRSYSVAATPPTVTVVSLASISLLNTTLNAEDAVTGFALDVRPVVVLHFVRGAF